MNRRPLFASMLFAPLLCLTLTDCVVTETGNPPLVERDLLASTSEAAEAILDGLPGAVDPAEGVVFLTNLERGSILPESPVREDGGFGLVLAGDVGDLFRLHARNEEGLSLPVDFIWTARGIDLPRPPCLRRTPSDEILFEEEVEITIENACAEVVMVDVRTTSRASVGAIELAPGGTDTVTLQRDGDLTLFGLAENGTARSGVTLSSP